MTGNRWICRLVPENQECAEFEETQNSKSCKNVYIVKKVCGMSHDDVKVCTLCFQTGAAAAVLAVV